MNNEGRYIRNWVPELREIRNKYIHKILEAPEHVLQKANIKLGNRYPFPIVYHNKERALYAYNF
ncbi:FAD-binding domain-containing protein [Bacillus cereus]